MRWAIQVALSSLTPDSAAQAPNCAALVTIQVALVSWLRDLAPPPSTKLPLTGLPWAEVQVSTRAVQSVQKLMTETTPKH